MNTSQLTRWTTLGLLAASCTLANAQDWPLKPVRIIVPFGAGGGTDIQARLLAKSFHESMKQTFLVDNRSGAGGIIGAEIAVRPTATRYSSPPHRSPSM